MKPENKFRVWFTEKLRVFVLQKSAASAYGAQKHADYATGGILDTDVSINGFTIWVEFKCLPACKVTRKIDVSPLQTAEIIRRWSAGVPALVVVGLPLGPRLGYEVAVFAPPIPEKVTRSDFRPPDAACEYLYTVAEVHAKGAAAKF